MQNDRAAIPVKILTGFLGAGKTSLINQLLKQANCGPVAVIVNEFGQIGLDKKLIKADGDKVIELENGCLCCTINSRLSETILMLLEKSPQQILIETSGIADPLPMINTLLGDPALSRKIKFAGLYCVFDTLHGAETLSRHIEAKNQLTLADRIVLTKLDLAKDRNQAFEQADKLLGPIAPTAKIVSADEMIKNQPDLWEAEFSLHNKQQSNTHHPTSKHKIKALSLVHDHPIEGKALELFFDLLFSAHQPDKGQHIIRFKALVMLKRQKQLLEIHGVNGVLSRPMPYARSESDTPIQSRLVILYQGLEEKTIWQWFNASIDKPASDTPDRQALTGNPLAIVGFSTLPK